MGFIPWWANGAKLSGSRQRIAIARALIRKPKLLILDEATSGLDSGAEESLFMSLRNLSEPYTIFAISHRSSFSTIADTLYGIEAGEIKPLKKVLRIAPCNESRE
jgi:ATP-binding cassette subfamily C protein